MLDNSRQLPATSAEAWSVDLAEAGGPTFIVMRRDEAEARRALTEHLIEIGSGMSVVEAEGRIAAAPVERVAVIW